MSVEVYAFDHACSVSIIFKEDTSVSAVKVDRSRCIDLALPRRVILGLLTAINSIVVGDHGVTSTTRENNETFLCDRRQMKKTLKRHHGANERTTR